MNMIIIFVHVFGIKKYKKKYTKRNEPLDGIVVVLMADASFAGNP